MSKGGADTSKLRLQYHDLNECSVFAAKDIKKGDIVLHVPDEMILNFEDVEIGLPEGISKEKLLKKWGPEILSKVYMYTHMLLER